MPKISEKKIVREIAAALRELKVTIEDSFRAYEDDSIPGIAITLGMTGDDWAIQTGDNQYFGNAYFYRYWGTGGLYRRTNCKELAQDLVDQCYEAQE